LLGLVECAVDPSGSQNSEAFEFSWGFRGTNEAHVTPVKNWSADGTEFRKLKPPVWASFLESNTYVKKASALFVTRSFAR
jgi:hypothetical protein